MKRKILSLIFTVLTAGRLFFPCVTASAEIEVSSKAAYLMDFDSCTEVFSVNEDKRLPIASMCKIMTLIICFDEVDSGNLSLEEGVPVSENASSMGGSQVFLESGATYRTDELIKSIIVCSANDSCVAMAERISGSVDMFVDRMNERAKELGAYNTLFSNCTGLPKEPQYSTAKDVALMLRELLRHDEYYRYSKIWTENFNHPESRHTEITNTNKLIRMYNGCDGGKTGFTNQAGFCLAATAKRGDLRLISVVIGAADSKSRFESVKNMFDYAFANYTNKIVVDDMSPLKDSVSVKGGKKGKVAVTAERKGMIFALKKEKELDVEVEFLPEENIKAPVNIGDKVGEIVIFRGGIECDRIAAVALEGDEKETFADCYRRAAEGWTL